MSKGKSLVATLFAHLATGEFLAVNPTINSSVPADTNTFATVGQGESALGAPHGRTNYVLAKSGQNCNQACANHGAFCNGNFPNGRSQTDSAFAEAGYTCTSAGPTAYDPRLQGSTCMFADFVDAGDKFVCSTDGYEADRRLCPCQSCNGGYKLSGKSCQADTCSTGSGSNCKTCRNQSQRTGNDQCTSCNGGYKLSGNSCQAYTCSTGSGSNCKTCVDQSNRGTDNQCAMCNSGYDLSDNICQALIIPSTTKAPSTKAPSTKAPSTMSPSTIIKGAGILVIAVLGVVSLCHRRKNPGLEALLSEETRATITNY